MSKAEEFFQKFPPNNRKINYIDIDPGKFGHPLATQISWEPLEYGGNHFKSHKLYQVSDQIMVFKAANRTWIYNSMVVLLGLIGLVIPIFRQEETPIWFKLTSVGLMALGIFLLFRSNEKRRFDKERGFYFRGKDPKPEEGKTYHRNCVPL
mgnify:CR=1 FL=1